MDQNFGGAPVLFCGNVTYFSNDDLLAMSGGHPVVVIGDGERKKTAEGISWFVREDFKQLTRLFAIHNFDTVVYVSKYLTWQSHPREEMNELNDLLVACRDGAVRRFEFLTTLDVCRAGEPTDIALELAYEERMCEHFLPPSTKMHFIRSPYFVGVNVEGDYFRDMFRALSDGRGWQFPVPGEEVVNTIATSDVVSFIARLLDLALDQMPREINLRGVPAPTMGSVATSLGLIYRGQNITCMPSTGEGPTEYGYGVNSARDILQWSASVNVLKRIEALKAQYKPSAAEKREHIKNTAIRVLRGRIAMIAELVLGALLMQFLVVRLGASVQFRVIDVRLLYVVLISCVYGMGIGMIAALFAIASLAFAYMSEGMSALQLLITPESWIPVILLLLTSVLCGFIHDNHEDDKRTYDDSLTEVKDDLTQTERYYKEAVAAKSRYEEELKRSQNGFGSVYAAARQLAVLDSAQLYERAVHVCENMFGNDSFSVYSADGVDGHPGPVAHLEACSRPLADTLDREIRLSDRPQIEKAVASGKAWSNRALEKDMPMYVASFNRPDGCTVIVMMHHAHFDQVNTYYLNLFELSVSLIHVFFDQAWSYERTRPVELTAAPAIGESASQSVENTDTRTQAQESTQQTAEITAEITASETTGETASETLEENEENNAEPLTTQEVREEKKEEETEEESRGTSENSIDVIRALRAQINASKSRTPAAAPAPRADGDKEDKEESGAVKSFEDYLETAQEPEEWKPEEEKPEDTLESQESAQTEEEKPEEREDHENEKTAETPQTEEEKLVRKMDQNTPLGQKPQAAPNADFIKALRAQVNASKSQESQAPAAPPAPAVVKSADNDIDDALHAYLKEAEKKEEEREKKEEEARKRAQGIIDARFAARKKTDDQDDNQGDDQEDSESDSTQADEKINAWKKKDEPDLEEPLPVIEPVEQPRDEKPDPSLIHKPQAAPDADFIKALRAQVNASKSQESQAPAAPLTPATPPLSDDPVDSFREYLQKAEKRVEEKPKKEAEKKSEEKQTRKKSVKTASTTNTHPPVQNGETTDSARSTLKKTMRAKKPAENFTTETEQPEHTKTQETKDTFSDMARKPQAAPDADFIKSLRAQVNASKNVTSPPRPASQKAEEPTKTQETKTQDPAAQTVTAGEEDTP